MRCSTSLASPTGCAQVCFCAAMILLFTSPLAVAQETCPSNVAGGGPYFKGAPTIYGVTTGINLTDDDKITVELAGVPKEVPTTLSAPRRSTTSFPQKV